VVVLFFYPKDGSAICTKEACAFRDAYGQFAEAGAVVIGVSGDSAERHSAFAARLNLPFYLVSDADGSIRKAFGVPKTLGLLSGRVTYVIDKEGVVTRIRDRRPAPPHKPGLPPRGGAPNVSLGAYAFPGSAFSCDSAQATCRRASFLGDSGDTALRLKDLAQYGRYNRGRRPC
jgi:hypothetical protein